MKNSDFKPEMTPPPRFALHPPEANDESLQSETHGFTTRTPKRVVLITSPKAGSGHGREQIPRLVSLLKSASIQVDVTDSLAEMRRLVDESAIGAPNLEGQDNSLVVVAAGGDGTMSLVAEHVSSQIPIVPMPLGTENLLARHFGMSAAAEEVLQTIRSGRNIRIDAGRGNGRLFLVVASAGFDAEVVRGLHLTRRGHIRRSSYIRPLIRALRRYPFPAIETVVDGELCSLSPLKWVMLFNLPRYAANLSIEPEACGDDGKLDLIGFTRGSVLSGLWYTGGFLCGLRRNGSDVIRQRGKVIEMRSKSRVPYQLDGDYVGHLPLRIETLPERVRLRVPA